MSRLPWREGKVFRCKVKGDLWTLGQMLESPYLLFFKSDKHPLAAEHILFPCPVTRQFLKHAKMESTPLSPVDYSLPREWIGPHPGSRHRVLWPGTADECTVLILSSKPGGRLIERSRYTKPPLMSDIPLDNHEIIDTHERADLWTFPLLNERLFLSLKTGKNVDPGKDIMFERPIPKSYKTYVDILIGRDSAEQWGYGDYEAK